LKNLERPKDERGGRGGARAGSVSARGVKGEARLLRMREKKWQRTDLIPPRLDNGMSRYSTLTLNPEPFWVI
jgi:hypothetical protein